METITKKDPKIINNHHIGFRIMLGHISYLVETEGVKQAHHHTRKAIQVIKNVDPRIDVESTIQWLESQGGHDDIEVLLNLSHLPYESTPMPRSVSPQTGSTNH
jgi:hypothetical protein